MQQFFSFIIMAILVEAIITYVSEIKSVKSPLILSLVLGVVVALAYGLDLPKELGIVSRLSYVGEVITGVVLSRGSNYLYDLLGRFTNFEK
ncbi:hypothetical protein [Guggenheimella bovis]